MFAPGPNPQNPDPTDLTYVYENPNSRNEKNPDPRDENLRPGSEAPLPI